MSIKLAIAGRPPIELSDENITLGSDPSCTVSFPESSGAKPKHAVIRKIAGRWLIEVRDAESIFVGGPEPKRMNWLNPGDVIRLTENGTDITFQPRHDEPLQSPPPRASVSPDPRVAPVPPPRVSPVPPLHDFDVILPPDSSPSLPVTRPVKPPSSATIRIPKASSSATIPTSKAPSSATIRAVKSSDGSSPQAMSSRSNSNIPVTGAKTLRGSDEPPPNSKSGTDEVDPNAPTLQRMSSWDDSLDEGGGLTPEQAEMRWIMMVVGRCVGGGLVVLLVCIAISWISKALKPAQYDQLSSSTPAPAVVAPATPQPSPITNPVPASPRSTPAPTRDPAPPKSKVEKEKPREEAMVDNSPEPKSTEPETKPPGKTPKSAPEPEPEKSMAEDSPPAKAESTSPSPTVQAVQEGIYAVMMEDFDKSKRIQVGTAWASSRRYLVTSATVVTAIQEHQQQGMTAFVIQSLTDKKFPIKNVRLHDSYRKAGESAEEAREKRDDTRFAADRANQVRFDLGVLDIGRMERLPQRLSMNAEPLDESKESVFMMVGYPFQEKEDADSATLDENSLKERRCKKPPAGTAPQNRDMELTIQFAADSNNRNWSGSPVFNRDHKVIGVFSQLPQPKTTSGKPIKAERGVAWIGRLHEFASDVD